MNRVAIGVDLGGTQIKLVALDRAQQIYGRASASTLANGSAPEAILANLISVTRNLLAQLPDEVEVEGFGFSVPCYTEGENWILRDVTNLPSLEGYPLRPALQEAFGPHIFTTYDTNAAGLAEFLWGAGSNAERLFFMGIGTGISASFFTRQSGMAAYTFNTLGDTGHLIVAPDAGIACPCGGYGCLETVAAAPAIRLQALEAARSGTPSLLHDLLLQRGDLSAQDVANAAWAGDAISCQIFSQVGRYLGIALASYLHMFAPSQIVLGGGVSLAGEVLLDPVRQTLEQLASPWYLQRLQGLLPSHFGLEAGATGSACLVFYPEIIFPSHS